MKIEIHARLTIITSEGAADDGVKVVLTLPGSQFIEAFAPRAEAADLLPKLGKLVTVTIDTDKEVR